MDAVLELQASLNSKGRARASSLIKRGAVSESRSWDGPSAEDENDYLADHSWAEYGAWFLGVDNDADPETKGHYKYPFSDDFKTVSVNGLRAIRGRSGQTGEKEIFNAAGPLLDAAKEKLGLSSGETLFKLQATFESLQNYHSVDMEAGTMSDVSIMEEGEAKGHNVLITMETLEGAAQALQGKSVPAYITHANAQGDRLTSEVGFFTGFYLDGGCEHTPYGPDWCKDKRKKKVDDRRDFPPVGPRGGSSKRDKEIDKAKKERTRKEENRKIREKRKKEQAKLASLRARKFQAFNSFRKYQPEAYDRLFEMAEMLPENFGVSLVFEARLFWEMDDGTEMEFEGWDGAPDGSVYELPTVEVKRVMSADFVDNPAANSSLFAEHKNIKETMDTETTEFTTAASEELERQKIAAGEMPEKPKPEAQEPPPKKKKKALEADDVAEILEDGDELLNSMDIDLADEEVIVAKLEAKLDERDKLINGMSGKVTALTKEVETLRELFAGAEPVAEDAAEEVTEQDFQALKAHALQEVMTANATMTKSCALLEVGKKHPEYFNN